MQEGQHILLTDRERQLVNAVKELFAVINDVSGGNPIEEIQIEDLSAQKFKQVDDAFCDLIRFMGLDPEDPKSNIKMYIEVVDLFHRTVPRPVVENTWSLILGPYAIITAMMGSLNPIVVAAELIKIIARLKVDADGWVEGLEPDNNTGRGI